MSALAWCRQLSLPSRRLQRGWMSIQLPKQAVDRRPVLASGPGWEGFLA
jgi:hypothetical protein